MINPISYERLLEEILLFVKSQLKEELTIPELTLNFHLQQIVNYSQRENNNLLPMKSGSRTTSLQILYLLGKRGSILINEKEDQES